MRSLPKILICAAIGTTLCTAFATAQNVTIGVVASSELHGEWFRREISDRKYETLFPQGFRIGGYAMTATQNPLQTAMLICDTLIPKQVYAVVFEVPEEREFFMTAVPFTFEYYRIPVVGVSMRSSLMSNKIMHPYFLRTIPPISHEAMLWVQLMTKLRYKCCLFVYVDDAEGQSTLSLYREYHLPGAIGKSKPEIKRMLALRPGEVSYREQLKTLVDDACRVILLAAGQTEAGAIFSAGEELGLLSAGYVWIVSERALHMDSPPTGVIGFRLQSSAGDVMSNIKDATTVVIQSLAALARAGRIGFNNTPPSRCSEPLGALFGPMADRPWQLGDELHRELMLTKLESGLTGFVSFDGNGDRKYALYDMINVGQNRSFKIVGKLWLSETPGGERSEVDAVNLKINESDIVWPGGQSEKPAGIKISSFLKAVTIVEQPFVNAYEIRYGAACNASNGRAERLCPKASLNGGNDSIYCCYGYVVDMLLLLERNLSVNISLHLAADDQHGSLVTNNLTAIKEWNGMMGELLTGKADMILAPFSMDPDRADFVDFSKPFKYLGLTILVKKATKESNLGSFLQPFNDTLWIIVGISVHAVALVLYLVDRFSPFNKAKVSRGAAGEDNGVYLSTLVWFSWGVLLNTGIGDASPRSFSARVLGMIWAGFAMIIVASYTANLAAFLVLDRPQAAVSGIDDTRLRNPTESFTYATVQNSAVDNYFKRQVEYTTMYRKMQHMNKKTVAEGIRAVKDGSLNAFIWEAPRLTYEAAQDCDLLTTGEVFGRTSYSFAFPKDSPWAEVVSSKILAYHERGYIEHLDKAWIIAKAKQCSEDESSSPATLGLTNMAGVFMMVAGGMLVGLVILLIEIICFKYNSLRKHDLMIARMAVDKWKCYVQKKNTLRRTWLIIRGGAQDISSLPETVQRQKMRKALLGKSDSNDCSSVMSGGGVVSSPDGGHRNSDGNGTSEDAHPLLNRRRSTPYDRPAVRYDTLDEPSGSRQAQTPC